MFELLKIIVETLAKSLSFSTLIDAKKKHDLGKIGTELFLLYTELNNILVTGREIVSELKNGLGWMEGKFHGGEPDREYDTELDHYLQQQSFHIQRFIGSMQRLRYQTQVIAPEAYNRLRPLLNGKVYALGYLLLHISGTSPRLVYADPAKLHALMDGSVPEPVWEEVERTNGVFEEVEIEDLSHIPARQHQVVREFLERQRPEEALEEIAKAAEMLREGIETHFSLTDILLEVGDKRCGADQPFQYLNVIHPPPRPRLR